MLLEKSIIKIRENPDESWDFFVFTENRKNNIKNALTFTFINPKIIYYERRFK